MRNTICQLYSIKSPCMLKGCWDWWWPIFQTSWAYFFLCTLMTPTPGTFSSTPVPLRVLLPVSVQYRFLPIQSTARPSVVSRLEDTITSDRLPSKFARLRSLNNAYLTNNTKKTPCPRSFNNAYHTINTTGISCLRSLNNAYNTINTKKNAELHTI